MRRPALKSLVVLSLVLAGCGASDDRAAHPAPRVDPVADPHSPEAAIRKLEKTPDQTMRVLVTVRIDKVAVEAAKAQVAEALRNAGAESVEPIEAQPILVVEAKAGTLRAALGTGQIARVQIDAPTTPLRAN